MLLTLLLVSILVLWDPLLNKLTPSHFHWTCLASEELEFVKSDRNIGQADICEDIKGHDSFLSHMAY
jgi:hypothetical protein